MEEVKTIVRRGLNTLWTLDGKEMGGLDISREAQQDVFKWLKLYT